MATAADVPGVYDIVINGQGYVYARQIDPNVPFRTQRAKYGYSPTFLERTNIQGNYGDNQQEFWLTASQNDWSLGEEQHFFRSPDPSSVRRYWQGTNIDVSTLGQAKLMGAASNVTFAAAVSGATSRNGGNALAASTTNLYDVDITGSITDLGAHGAGLSDPSTAAIATDGSNIFIGGDTGQIRKYNGAYSNFSATLAQRLCFVGNTLWGVNSSTLSYYSTAGVASTAFQWKTADGTVTGYGRGLDIKPFGGSVVVMRPGVGTAPTELWTANTTGATQIAQFPTGFIGHKIAVINGIIFVVGAVLKKNYGYRTEVWYYANGNIGKTYVGENYASGYRDYAICEYDNGFVFSDAPNQRVLAYDLNKGAVSTIANYTQPALGAPLWMAPNDSGLLITNNTSTGIVLPTASAATSGTIITSLFDFDSSLKKLFRGITVEFSGAGVVEGGGVGAAGNSGSVDIEWQTDSAATGGFTTLQTGAVTGTEYLLTLFGPVTGHTICFRITLNKGTSTNGPVLKRIYVRGVPIQQTFRHDEVILDCTGRDGHTPVQLRNGNSSPKDGMAMIADLRTAITSTNPITITDRFGSITAVIEAGDVEIIEVNDEEFYVRLPFREV